MNKKYGTFVFFMVFLFVATGCATLGSAGHKYFMKGQILETADGRAYLCIGSAEGAKAGQEFPVYHYAKSRTFSEKQSPPVYTREKVGTVKIAKVVDDHYAWAEVLNGHVTAGDVAELKW
jgi:hypothetical protein